MVQTKIYCKNKKNEKMPAVLGMPGFVGSLKQGRIEQILRELSKRGFFGMGMMYDGIEKKGEKVVCNFNLDTYLKNMQEAFEVL